MDISFCELRSKEVVNMADGKKLGHIIDISITLSGQVLGLVLPGDKNLFRAVNANNCLFVPWRNICRMGDDIILVNICQNGIVPTI